MRVVEPDLLVKDVERITKAMNGTKRKLMRTKAKAPFSGKAKRARAEAAGMPVATDSTTGHDAIEIIMLQGEHRKVRARRGVLSALLADDQRRVVVELVGVNTNLGGAESMSAGF